MIDYKARNTITGKLETIIMTKNGKLRIFRDGKGWKVIYNKDGEVDGVVIDECFKGARKELLEYIKDDIRAGRL